MSIEHDTTNNKLIIKQSCMACDTRQFISHENRHLINGPLRYCAFANDVGEAMKAVIPRSLYLGSYGITTLYAISAVYGDYLKKKNQLVNSHNESNQDNKNICVNYHYIKKQINKELTKEIIDKSIWHAVASIALTPFVIHKLKHYTSHTLMRGQYVPTENIPKFVPKYNNDVFSNRVKNIFGTKIHSLNLGLQYGFSNYGMRATTIPTVLGLLSIPVIVPPIDNGMTAFMNMFRVNKEPYHWTGLWGFVNGH